MYSSSLPLTAAFPELYDTPREKNSEFSPNALDQAELLDEELKAKGFSMKFCIQKRFAALLTFLVELFL